jgi:hypothetical protein
VSCAAGKVGAAAAAMQITATIRVRRVFMARA